MEIFEKQIYSFKAQSDKFIGYNPFKCNLFNEPFNRHDLFFTISIEHINPLFGSTNDDLMIGEYGELRDYYPEEKLNDDEIKLTMVFNLDGLFFEARYVININTGEVSFDMDKPMICKEDFKIPSSMENELAALIKEKMEAGNRLVSIDDERFDKYYSDKFLSTFIDFVEYLENIILVDKCKDCVYKRPYRLSGFCKKLYVENRFK